LEPGRIITGESCIFICKVTDIKLRNNTQFIGVDASSVQFPRPLFYPNEAFHPVTILDEKLNVININYLNSNIYGCSTYSRDFLAGNISLPETQLGNYIIFANSGSYCSSAYTRFLGFKPAKELIF
jgi:diaminopimelate decarboxylase